MGIGIHFTGPILDRRNSQPRTRITLQVQTATGVYASLKIKNQAGEYETLTIR